VSFLQPTGYTFKNAFSKYGLSPDTLDQEIKNDLLAIVQDSVKTLPFSRGTGLGVEALENEPLNFVDLALIQATVANNVGLYNAGVTPDRQVITSQELIDIVEDEEGTLYIQVQYFQQKDLGTSNPTLNDLLAPYRSN